MSGWKIVLITLCGCAGVATLGSVVENVLHNAEREKTKRTQEEEITKRLEMERIKGERASGGAK